MFNFFKKKRISNQTRKAREFLNITFVPNILKKDPTNETSPDSNSTPTSPISTDNVRYSLKDDISTTPSNCHEPSSSGGIKFSKKGPDLLDPLYGKRDIPKPNGDNYNFSTVSRAMRSFKHTNDLSKLSKELDEATDKTFVDTLITHIDQRKLRDSDLYKAAQIDRRLFSKIMSDRHYKPSKDTALAIALSLKLSINESLDLLSRAGYTLSHSSKRDVLMEYFFREKIFKLDDVNMILYNLGEKIIGR